MNSETCSRTTFGLTGIMGSGKSTVAEMLALRGAIVISEDEIVKILQEPGGHVLDAMTTVLGKQILAENKSLDRPKTARMIFADDIKRHKVEAIIHPLVVAQIERGIKHATCADIILIDASVLLTKGKINTEHIIHVDVPREIAITRLVAQKGLNAADCKKRLSLQIPEAKLSNSADYVINNAGSLKDLEKNVDKLWKWMKRLSSAKLNKR